LPRRGRSWTHRYRVGTAPSEYERDELVLPALWGAARPDPARRHAHPDRRRWRGHQSWGSAGGPRRPRRGPRVAPTSDGFPPGCQASARRSEAVSRPACSGTCKDGRACRAPALSDSGLCWAHDPRHAEQAVKARAEGASRGGKIRALQGRRRRLTTPAALIEFVNSLIWDAIDGKHEPKLVNAVVGAVNAQRALLEQADLEQRLAALEAAAGAQRRIR
jgi:hypothetical protein